MALREASFPAGSPLGMGLGPTNPGPGPHEGLSTVVLRFNPGADGGEGAAQRSGVVNRGDLLASMNGEDLRGLGHQEVGRAPAPPRGLRKRVRGGVGIPLRAARPVPQGCT